MDIHAAKLAHVDFLGVAGHGGESVVAQDQRRRGVDVDMAGKADARYGVDVHLEVEIAQGHVSGDEIRHGIHAHREVADARGRRATDRGIDPSEAAQERVRIAIVVDHLGSGRNQARDVEGHQAGHQGFEFAEPPFGEPQRNPFQGEPSIRDGLPPDQGDLVAQGGAAISDHFGHDRLLDLGGIEGNRHAEDPRARDGHDGDPVHMHVRHRLEIDVDEEALYQHLVRGREFALGGAQDQDVGGAVPAAEAAEERQGADAEDEPTHWVARWATIGEFRGPDIRTRSR